MGVCTPFKILIYALLLRKKLTIKFISDVNPKQQNFTEI